MRIEIDIPKEFEEHFARDKFKDSLERIMADINHSLVNGDCLCAGRYEYETIEMLEKAFEGSRQAYDVDKVVSEAFQIAIKALEKQIPKKPKHTLIKHGKHTWRKKENGEVDNFAWDFDYHNGVACEICGETVCVHCNPNYDELTDCEEEYWNCPSCGKKIYSKLKYCDCGQAIDWSDEE